MTVGSVLRWPPMLGLGLGLGLGLALTATAQPRPDGRPVALVDSISITLPGIGAMDYLAAGTSIDLGADGKLVVDYLASCIREEIQGGMVKIGAGPNASQSTVDRGKVTRKRVECDGAELQLTAAQSDQGGVAVYRSAMNKGPDGLPLADLTLHSRAPFFALRRPGALRIERLDAAEPLLELNAADRAGIDLGRTQTQLSPGGLYRASAGDRSLVFRITPDAGGAEIARLSRLVPL